MRGPWQKVSDAIRVALEELTLAEIAGSFPGQDMAARTDAQGALISPLNDRT